MNPKQAGAALTMMLLLFLLFGCTSPTKNYIVSDKNISGDLVVQGNLSVDGNFYYEPPHMYGVSNTEQSLNSVGVFKAVDWNFAQSDMVGFTQKDTNCIIVNYAGSYFANFEGSFQDYSASPDSTTAIRIVKNGVEVVGSYAEKDIFRFNATFDVSSFAYLEADVGDVLCMEWAATDIDVNLATHGALDGSGTTARGFIKAIDLDN